MTIASTSFVCRAAGAGGVVTGDWAASQPAKKRASIEERIASSLSTHSAFVRIDRAQRGTGPASGGGFGPHLSACGGQKIFLGRIGKTSAHLLPAADQRR